MVRPRKISSFKPTLTNLAQTSHYQVQFGGLDVQLRKHLNVRGIDYRFITNTSGILCQSAVLPGSGMATAQITGNRMGVTENMVHSRIYTPIQLEFYVDNEYKALKFLTFLCTFIKRRVERGRVMRLGRYGRPVDHLGKFWNFG